MLFAKLALGLCGTVAVAGAYTFHDGVMRVDVDEDSGDSTHVHVWLPAAIVPIAMRFVPDHQLERATAQVGPWLPTLRALTKELRKFPEAELVAVDDGKDHVRIRTHNGKLLIDVTEPGTDVHVACPMAMMDDIASELEAKTPGA
jgi:hypothetical protein